MPEVSSSSRFSGDRPVSRSLFLATKDVSDPFRGKRQEVVFGDECDDDLIAYRFERDGFSQSAERAWARVGRDFSVMVLASGN